MLELSGSDLESEGELDGEARDSSAPFEMRRISRPLFSALRASSKAEAITARPPPLEGGPAAPPGATARAARRRTLMGLLVSHGALALVVALVAGSGSPASTKNIGRDPHVALPERTPLVAPAGAPVPSAPAGGCAASGGARVLASHAQLAPGLEVSVLETGFGVGLASTVSEAVGLRVEGSGLRIAETVRVKAPATLTHVVVCLLYTSRCV